METKYENNYNYIGEPVKETKKGIVTEYKYDYGGRVISWKDSVGAEYSVEYDMLGRKTGETVSNGGRTEYTYDKNSRVIQIKAPFSRDSKDFGQSAGKAVRKYKYDENGNVTEERVKITETKEWTSLYEYDSENILVKAETRRDYTLYEYDKAVNRVKMTTGNVTEERVVKDKKTYVRISEHALTGAKVRDENENAEVKYTYDKYV